MKDIKDYEGLYAVTEDGKVWSYRSKKFLKPKIKSNGYYEITLSVNDVKSSRLIHRLVAETYIPNPDNLPQVSHIDEDCNNNSVENLKWATAKENCNMPKHKERKSKAHMNNASSKKVICKETGIVYPSMSEAGRQMGCSPQNIRHACLDSNKTACGYHWEKFF